MFFQDFAITLEKKNSIKAPLREETLPFDLLHTTVSISVSSGGPNLLHQTEHNTRSSTVPPRGEVWRGVKNE